MQCVAFAEQGIALRHGALPSPHQEMARRALPLLNVTIPGFAIPQPSATMPSVTLPSPHTANLAPNHFAFAAHCPDPLCLSFSPRSNALPLLNCTGLHLNPPSLCRVLPCVTLRYLCLCLTVPGRTPLWLAITRRRYDRNSFAFARNDAAMTGPASPLHHITKPHGTLPLRFVTMLHHTLPLP